MKDKSSLRTFYLELLKKQASTDRQTKSQIITAKLFELPAILQAQTILFYASLPVEVDTSLMIKKAKELKKNICLPIVVQNQKSMIPTLTKELTHLENGVYGIAQPRYDASLVVDLKDIDCVVVPGLAFDKSNNRLGRGAGYYDRFLSQLSTDTKTIGLAFDFQLTESLPVEQHDIALSAVITN